MTRGRLLLVGVPLLVAALTAPPAASEPSHAGGTGLWDVRTARVPVRGTLAFQLSGTAFRITEDLVEGSPENRDLVDGGFQVSWSPVDRVELFGLYNAAVSSYAGSTSISPRDGRAGLKLGLPGLGPFRTALVSHLNLPWGSRARGYSTDALDPNVTAALTLPISDSSPVSATTLHLNVGYQWHGDDRGRAYEGWPPYYLEPVYPGGNKDRLDLRGAFEFRGEKVALFFELVLDRILNDAIAYREGPLFLTPGFRYTVWRGLGISAASRIALASDDPSTTRYRPPHELFPDWQLAFALTWSQDGPSVDRDEDGVPDWKDRCPNEREDRDGWADDDGCPDEDNDGDGVPDRFDAAPDDPEDVDGYADEDGVPDPDNDGDGVPDIRDVCPGVPEDHDGVQDDDGCPERDADGDRILDENDKCPEEPEDVDGVDDEDGCPDEVGVGAPYLLEGVAWEGRAVEPKRSSYLDLNRLAERLLADPEQRVEIVVYSPGPDASGAERLALLRAEYLKAFLVTTGVDPHRVVARGDPGQSIFDSALGGRARPGHALVEVVPRERTGVANGPGP
jgi:hypothetical protein